MKANIKRIETAIESYWGRKCPTYEKSCTLCKVWNEWESIKKVVEIQRPNITYIEIKDVSWFKLMKFKIRLFYYNNFCKNHDIITKKPRGF